MSAATVFLFKIPGKTHAGAPCLCLANSVCIIVCVSSENKTYVYCLTAQKSQINSSLSLGLGI